MIEILWLLFAASCGLTEGFLLHGRPPIKTKPDKHDIFTFQRTVVAIGFAWSMYPDFQHIAIFTGYAVLTFSLLHNGAMYEARKYLSGGNLYPRGWVDESTTTDAKISMSFFNRLWLFIAGMALYFSYLILKHL